MGAVVLRFFGLTAIPSETGGKGPRLQVVTALGAIREIPLSRADLLRIIQLAAAALEQLDKEDSR